MPGLLPQHHGELNKMNVPRARFDELRTLYANDPRALQQIEVDDPLTEYQDHIQSFICALKKGDTIAELIEEAWIEENYPDL